MKAYLAAGRGRYGQVGQAKADLIEAQDLVDFGVHWMTVHLGA